MRRAAQTRALLGHMMPTLRAYVPTASHVKAVRALSEHKIVLLIGDPASGKSTIAAVLSTIASDNPKHRCYKADGPSELLQNRNPHEAGGFYWIDDAFGPNQLREDYVDSWVSIMPKVQAAITTGNSFVLTSRRHIYEAASQSSDPGTIHYSAMGGLLLELDCLQTMSAASFCTITSSTETSPIIGKLS